MPDDETKQPTGGFRQAAEYFETRARRARNEADHEHHLNAARFYRELAGITPAVPPRYVPPKDVSRANRYRNRAEECRTIADLLVDANCKKQMADLATTYDSLAATYEKPGADTENVITPRFDALRPDTRARQRDGGALAR